MAKLGTAGLVFVTVFAGLLWCVHGQLEARTLFSQWKHEHNRRYKTDDEERARFATFQDNLLKIEKLNAEYSGTEFATNQFADMSGDEFRSKILMRPLPPPQHPRERYLRADGEVNDLPEAYNWVDHGAVTPIKDQGSAGSCWAFSTIENLEGQWFLAKHPLTNLSVEQVVDCDDNTDPKTGNADCGVFGGWPYLAFQYIKRVGGIEKEEDYPYCSGLGGEKGTCFPCPAPAYNASMCGPAVSYCNETESCGFRLDKSKFIPGLQVTDWAAIDTNETTIAVQLMKIGPLSVALNAVLLQFYHRGVFEPHFCDPKSLDHAVLLTGWGVEKTIFGEKKPYWIIKNSWGKKWGMDGYFYIKRGVGQCGINTQVATAILQKT
ncbi:cysteine proteinase 1-like [Branchiostoma floridae]|uniref:Cysteine proteinase 1-like n=1 Tax=Branchiostoma floridae TaxID=7739 RepID=A0A9J7LDA3_BRAFL|nr:cysteine proteinase 1-like [Branchiostoma floridae]